MIASLAFRNVLRNKERSLLTLVGVVLAIGSFVALVSLATGFTQRVEREFESRSVNIYVSAGRASSLPASPLAGAGSNRPMLPAGLEQRLEGMEGIASVTPIIKSSLDSERSVIPVLALPFEDVKLLFRGAQFSPQPDTLEVMYRDSAPEPGPEPSASPDAGSPGPMPPQAKPSAERLKVYPVAVGYGLDQEVEKATVGGALVVEEIQCYRASNMSGSGFLEYVVLAPIESFREQRATRGVHEFWIVIQNRGDLDRLRDQVEAEVTAFMASEHEAGRYTGAHRVKVLTDKQYLRSAREYLSYGWLLQVAVAMVGVLIAVTASMNTMLMSTYERLGEYATLRAIGASRRVIAMTIVYEATFLNVTGGLLGLLFGSLATGVLDRAVAIILEIPYPMAGVTPALLLQALALSLGVGLAGAVIPIFIVSRIDLVAQLRKGM